MNACRSLRYISGVDTVNTRATTQLPDGASITQISLVLPGHQLTARRERNRSRPQGGGLLLSRRQWKRCFHWLAKCVDRFTEGIAVKSAAACPIRTSPKRLCAAAQGRERRVSRQGTVTLTLPC